jgi:hypothetical protein
MTDQQQEAEEADGPPAAARGATPNATDRSSTYGVGFWIGVLVGGGLIAYGLIGMFGDLGDDWLNWLVYLVGADLLHDVLIAPFVALFGWLCIRRVPPPWRAPLESGLILTVFVLLVGLIPLAGWGGNPGNPTIRPLNYTTSVLTAIALVWLAVAVVTSLVWWRRGRPRPA